MKCAVKALYLLLALFSTANGDECYRAEFSEDVWPCADFDNEVMKCDPLELGVVDGDDGGLGLHGKIGLDSEIEDGTMMNVEIWKIIDVGKEYLYHTQGDICGSLQDRNTPWFPMIDAMKINECPIAVKSYEVKDMVINLDHAKDMLTHEMCGEYIVQLSMTKELDKLSCHELGISVSEYSCNKTK